MTKIITFIFILTISSTANGRIKPEENENSEVVTDNSLLNDLSKSRNKMEDKIDQRDLESEESVGLFNIIKYKKLPYHPGYKKLNTNYEYKNPSGHYKHSHFEGHREANGYRKENDRYNRKEKHYRGGYSTKDSRHYRHENNRYKQLEKGYGYEEKQNGHGYEQKATEYQHIDHGYGYDKRKEYWHKNQEKGYKYVKEKNRHGYKEDERYNEHQQIKSYGHDHHKEDDGYKMDAHNGYEEETTGYHNSDKYRGYGYDQSKEYEYKDNYENQQHGGNEYKVVKKKHPLFLTSSDGFHEHEKDYVYKKPAESYGYVKHELKYGHREGRKHPQFQKEYQDNNGYEKSKGYGHDEIKGYQATTYKHDKRIMQHGYRKTNKGYDHQQYYKFKRPITDYGYKGEYKGYGHNRYYGYEQTTNRHVENDNKGYVHKKTHGYEQEGHDENDTKYQGQHYEIDYGYREKSGRHKNQGRERYARHEKSNLYEEDKHKHGRNFGNVESYDDKPLKGYHTDMSSQHKQANIFGSRPFNKVYPEPNRNKQHQRTLLYGQQNLRGGQQESYLTGYPPPLKANGLNLDNERNSGYKPARSNGKKMIYGFKPILDISRKKNESYDGKKVRSYEYR